MRLRTMAALIVFVLAAVSAAFAQETTGAVRGRIQDPQGLPVPGVTVTVTGGQGAQTAVTDADGRFNFPFLTPGTYRVRAELQGFKAAEKNNVIVSLGQTVDMPLKMEVGGLTETVDVTAAPTVIDTTSTTTGANIDSETLQRVPVGRRVSDTLYIAPGVSSSGSVGSANPSISGGSGLENQYVIDGVNVTNQGYGALGSYSIVFGSLGNATPFDFVKEVQVKTGGYEAEFGQSTGGVVNVVTKSGSNELRGSLFGYARPSGLESEWTQVTSPNGTINIVGTRVADAGAEGGGPVIKNHLFFFGAIDPSWERRTSASPGPVSDFPLFAQNPWNRDRRTVSYSAKATWQLTSGHRIDASFFGDPSKGLLGPQRGSALLNQDTSGFSSLTYGGHNQTVRYDGVLSGNFLIETYFARALNDINELPAVNTWHTTDRTITPNVITGGIGFFEAGNHSLNNQYAAKATNIFGGHQIKYGVEYDDVTYSNINQRTGPTFTTPVGDKTATGAEIQILPDPTFGKIYRVVRANLNSARVTTQKYVDFFVQDSWKVTNRLTVNPGLRYEQEKMNGTLVSDFQLKNNWAPRIGAAYDMTGDGKSKLFGNFGIFYARVPNDLAARALSADAGIGADYFDANLTQPIPNGTLAGGKTVHYSIAGAGADSIDPNTKLSYVREFVIGAEREVMPHTTVGVRYINRRIPRVLEDVANCPMAAYDLAATSKPCGSVDYILTNPSSSTPVNPAVIAIDPRFAAVQFASPVHKYDAVEFTINKRMSDNWAVLASYRWSRLHGNFEGFYRDDNGQSDPGISSLYDFPTNDPTYTSIGTALGYPGDIRFLADPNGILPLDRPHQGKVFGNYQFPFGLNIGLGVNLSSGKPLTPLAPNPNTNYQNGGEIPTGPRGSGIQTVDGFKTRTPFQSQVDLQAAYDLKIGGLRHVAVMADIFNLFNQQTILDYDNWTEITFGAGPNPNFGLPTSSLFAGNPPQYQTPRQVRLGVRFSF